MADPAVNSSSSVKTDKFLINHVIADSGAFLRNTKLEGIGENIYTLPEVVNEIKDKGTKQRLQVLPYELQFRTPSADDILFITEFSKKTGDYSSLSATDIKVLALSYLIHKEQIGVDNLRKEPLKGSQVISNSYVKELNQSIVGFYAPREEEELELEDKLNELNITNEEDIENELSSSEDSDNDEDTWITPENLEEARRKMGALDTLPADIKVACLTTDFAMQNVLIQIGIHVISLDGLLIKQARTFILRCFACFNTTSIMTKQFCPKCGNKTLKRVAVSIGKDGVKTVHLNFRKPINIRGTRYSLPTPKGGKHAVNPIICEDQQIPQNRPNKMGKEVVDIFDPAFEVRNSPFALNDVYSRAGKLGIRNKATSQRKTNPNSSGKRTGNKSSRKRPLL